MRISDWSSDVCSSDLLRLVRVTQRKLFQPASWNAQHGDVGPRIAAEKLGFDLPITNANGNGAGILDDMVVGENQTARGRSEEHTSELQSLMRISYAVFCLKKKKKKHKTAAKKDHT